MMAATTWESVLADLSSRIDLAEQCLEDGGDLDTALLEPWTPPNDLGPLPSRLREQAVAINARQVQVQARLQTAQGTISSELARSTHASRNASMYAEKDVPAFFDSAV